LEQHARDEGAQRISIDVAFDVEPVAERQLLNSEILLQKLEFRCQRTLLVPFRIAGDRDQIAEVTERLHDTVLIALQRKNRDRLQRIEEEMRAHLRLQRLELGLRQARFEMRLRYLPPVQFRVMPRDV